MKKIAAFAHFTDTMGMSYLIIHGFKKITVVHSRKPVRAIAFIWVIKSSINSIYVFGRTPRNISKESIFSLLGNPSQTASSPFISPAQACGLKLGSRLWAPCRVARRSGLFLSIFFCLLASEFISYSHFQLTLKTWKYPLSAHRRKGCTHSLSPSFLSCLHRRRQRMKLKTLSQPGSIPAQVRLWSFLLAFYPSNAVFPPQ